MNNKNFVSGKRFLRLVSILMCTIMLLSACSSGNKINNDPTGKTEEVTQELTQVNNVKDDKNTGSKLTVDPNLKKVGSYSEFVKLLKSNDNFNSDQRVYYGLDGGIMKEQMVLETTAAVVNDSAESGATGSSDYSTTNNQVQSVDEADIVKTDGKYFYYLNAEKITVVAAGENGKLSLVGEVTFNNKENTYFYPNELLLDGNVLIAIGTYYEAYVPEGKEIIEQSESDDTITYDVANDDMYMPRYMSGRNMTKVICYDITDKSNINEIRNIEIDGNYVTSRKIGSMIYLVSNKYFDYYRILNENNVKEEEILPEYKDSAVSEEYKLIASTSLLYYEDFNSANYMTIAGFDINNLNKGAELTTILGAAQNIYVSENNMYIAKVNYHYNNINTTNPKIMPLIEESTSEDVTAVDDEMADDIPEVVEVTSSANSPSTVNDGEPDEVNVAADMAIVESSTYDTDIYKLSLSDGKAIPTGSANVPGSLINQFSMDEHNGYFRVATTTGETWNEENPSYNNLYVLDEQLNIVGKIENLAKGERIYSTRFMGDKLYMVTFKQVDPLFVIDLSNPEAPVVAGELKLPGYSSYMQAYDENHIIGIGYDTRVVTENYGAESWERVEQLGLKIAMFDVSDMKNPKLLHEVIVGNQGTYSEALYNHKAVLFSRDKNLFALPINVATTTTDSKGNIYNNYEGTSAYVYNISVENGFVLSGTIKHETTIDENGYRDYNNEIKRIQYIGDKLYTFTNIEIKSSDINTLNTLYTLKLK